MTNVVLLPGKEIVSTSRMVAADFGKRHKNVMEAMLGRRPFGPTTAI